MAQEYKTELNIEGMTCEHCQKAVKGALERVPGVQRAAVDLNGHSASIEGAADVQLMLRAVEEEGYRASLNTQTAR
jgi:copper chaperone